MLCSTLSYCVARLSALSLCVFPFLSVLSPCVFYPCFLSVLSVCAFCLCFLSGFAFYRATKNDTLLSINFAVYKIIARYFGLSGSLFLGGRGRLLIASPSKGIACAPKNSVSPAMFQARKWAPISFAIERVASCGRHSTFWPAGLRGRLSKCLGFWARVRARLVLHVVDPRPAPVRTQAPVSHLGLNKVYMCVRACVEVLRSPGL